MTFMRPGSGWHRRIRPAVAGLLLAASIMAAPTAPRLNRSGIRLEPSLAQLETLPRFPPRWRLSPEVAAQLPDLLRERGFPVELISALQTRMSLDPATGEGLIVPDLGLLAAFSPESRQAWSLLLALHSGNVAERWPLSLSPATMARLRERPEWSEAVQRLERWGRASGDRLGFSDLFVLDEVLREPATRRSFFQTVLGGEASLLKLLAPSDVSASAAYWQVGGRFRSVEPFLNAMAGLHEAPRLDIAHLLPRLARSLMNTFPPDLAQAEDPGIESSYLASDFFALAPGVERSEPGGFAGWLERHCVPAGAPLQYGDLLVYGDLERNPWPYTVVHLADGTVFGRRPTMFGPWQFLEQEQITTLNPRLGGRLPHVFRLRRLAEAPADPQAPLPARMPSGWRKRLELRPLPEGPWGRLWVYDVLLAPSTDLLLQLPEPDRTPAWAFAGLDRAQALREIAAIPMEPKVKRELEQAFIAGLIDAGGRLTVRPGLELVWSTPQEVRERLFPFLIGGTSVADYAQHIPFPAGLGIDEWLETGALPESVRSRLRQLVYPRDGRTVLSDYGALYHAFPSVGERLSAQRAALRFPSLVVLLEKPATQAVPGLVRYWRNQQGKSVAALLASFAASGDDSRYLDIVHLLPPIGREFVNTYFAPEAPSRTPSCYWTAFNFDQERPDDRYLVVPGLPDLQGEAAWRELMTRFDLLEAPSQLGDVIVYRRSGASTADHVCTYIADGVVFTKDGSAFSAPWRLTRESEVDAVYLNHPDAERLAFRRR